LAQIVEKRTGLLEGGSPGDAISSRDELGGFCSEDLVKSDQYGDEVSHLKVLATVESMGQFESGSSDCEQAQNLLIRMFPNLGLGAVGKVLEHYSGQEIPFEVAQEACKGKRLFLPKYLKLREMIGIGTSSSTDAAISKVNEQLDGGAIVAIEYMPGSLPFKWKYEWWTKPLAAIGLLKVWGGTERPEPGDPNVGHSSTIVGRRFNVKSNSCEYRVRNTWGSSCDILAHCDNGDIWVAEKDLKRALFSLTYFENSQK
jgi:hypothetical protein